MCGGEGTEEGEGGNERAQTKTEWVSMKALTFTQKKRETKEMRENNTSNNGHEKPAMDGNEEHVGEESSPVFKMSHFHQMKSAAIMDDTCASLELIYP